MPQNYKRKTDRASWSTETMQRAINACRNGEMGIRRASKAFNIPKSTIAKKLKLPGNHEVAAKFGRKPCLGSESEDELARLIIELEGHGFGLSRPDVKALAFEYAERNGLPHDFNKKNKEAGRVWLFGFLKRNPNIVLSKACARGTCMNREVISKYFERLGDIIDREGMHQTPEKLYSVNETGIQRINRPGTVLTQNGKRSVVAITDTDKRENVTVVGCCSAAGHYILPYVIFKGKRMLEEYQDGLPAGSKVVMSETSYINKDLFLDWLKFFRRHCIRGKVLLLIDGHASHVKSMAVLQYCIENEIIFVCLPGHTKYIQPLDQTVFKSLKVNYFQNVKHRNPEMNITKYHFGSLFASAWAKTATLANAASGFRTCGIYPFNPDAIPEEFYTPSETTERELVPDQQHQQRNPDPGVNPSGEETSSTPTDENLKLLLKSSIKCKVGNNSLSKRSKLDQEPINDLSADSEGLSAPNSDEEKETHLVNLELYHRYVETSSDLVMVSSVGSDDWSDYSDEKQARNPVKQEKVEENSCEEPDIPLQPVISQPIFDKNYPALEMVQIDRRYGSACGGDKLFILCSKIQRDDITVKFFDADWSDYARFSPADIHRQVAIVCRTPPYKDVNITEPKRVYFKLVRPSDKDGSQAIQFTYLPNKKKKP